MLDGITFQLGPTNDGAPNSMSCQGQQIPLPAGYDQLYLLAASASNDLSASFEVDGQATTLTVPYFTDFIGQWNPPFLKREEVALALTHRHTGAGANDAYRFCYLFKHSLSVPPGASTLTLPNAPNIRIFAMSLGQNTSADTVTAGGLIAGNLFPWAEAGPDRLVNASNTNSTTLTLDGSASADPDGTILFYNWSTNGVTIASDVQADVTLPIGTNTIVLAVTDDQGALSHDILTVTILPALEVTLSASPTNGTETPLVVNFSGQATGGNTENPSDTTDDQSGVIAAQGENSPSETAREAFDNNPTSKWLDFANGDPSTRSSWLQYEYAGGQQVLVTSYTLTSANDTMERDPADWRLLGSNNGGATWTVLDTRVNEVFNARFEKRAFTISNPAAYPLYRLQVDRVANPAAANSVQLAELELIGTPIYAYQWSFGDGATTTLQNPQHAFNNTGSYLVELAVSLGLYTGTNTALITVGQPLTALLDQSSATGAPPMTLQFSGQAAGGNGARTPYDTTDDQLGLVTVQGDNPPNETGDKAFDNSLSTKWLDFAYAFPDTRSTWIQYEYANGLRCVLSGYTVSSANDTTGFPGRSPQDWRLLGSNDDGATWTTLDTRTNQAFTGNSETQVYSVSKPIAHNLHRLVIDRVWDSLTANSMQLSELEFIGRPEYAYAWSFGDGSVSTEQNPEHTYTSNGVYTVQLTVSDGAASASATTTVNVLSLSLAIAMAGDGDLTLSWPDWADAFQLYSTTNLAPPIAWSPVTESVTQVGDSFTVAFEPTNNARFFRLAMP
jgi:PKD repeat protein